MKDAQGLQHRPLEFGGRRRTADDPAIEIMVGLIDQHLEVFKFGLGHGRQASIGEGAQDKVGLAEPTMPGAITDLLEAGFKHGNAHIERQRAGRHPRYA